MASYDSFIIVAQLENRDGKVNPGELKNAPTHRGSHSGLLDS